MSKQLLNQNQLDNINNQIEYLEKENKDKKETIDIFKEIIKWSPCFIIITILGGLSCGYFFPNGNLEINSYSLGRALEYGFNAFKNSSICTAVVASCLGVSVVSLKHKINKNQNKILNLENKKKEREKELLSKVNKIKNNTIIKAPVIETKQEVRKYTRILKK